MKEWADICTARDFILARRRWLLAIYQLGFDLDQQRPFQESAERSKFEVLRRIGPFFPRKGLVLEIGSGTGRQAVYFAKHFPSLIWQTSDSLDRILGRKS